MNITSSTKIQTGSSHKGIEGEVTPIIETISVGIHTRISQIQKTGTSLCHRRRRAGPNTHNSRQLTYTIDICQFRVG